MGYNLEKVIMVEFNPEVLSQLYVPSASSHKAQNGKVLIIGGSHLFHAASLWALQIASKIVDMVFYSSVDENNHIVFEAKKEFRNGIIVPRENLEDYMTEADCVLIGPGMVRTEEKLKPTEDYDMKSLKELNEIDHEGLQTYYLTKFLLKKYPEKRWVIDAGALQMMRPEWLLELTQTPILTPHKGEFERLFGIHLAEDNEKNVDVVCNKAKEFGLIIIVKGVKDIVASKEKTVLISGGNSGMTKGGTGDVLAGLTASLYAKNPAFLSACAASYINKKAGDSLFKRVGFYFNASDLTEEIPKVMKETILAL